MLASFVAASTTTCAPAPLEPPELELLGLPELLDPLEPPELLIELGPNLVVLAPLSSPHALRVRHDTASTKQTSRICVHTRIKTNFLLRPSKRRQY
jgi:hypothetical protein